MATPPWPSQSPATNSLTFPPQHYAKLSPLSFLHGTLASSPSEPYRPNGRTPNQYRSPTINTSSLTNANGSAVIRLGNTSVVCGVRAELLPVSHIHGGLPRELENWDGPGASSSSLADSRSDANLIAELNLLVPNLELNTGCSPSHIPGNAPSPEAQSLTQRILTLLRVSDLVPLQQLLVWEERPFASDDDAMATDNPNNPDAVTASGTGDDESPKFVLRAIWTLYIDILYISLDGSAFSAGWLALLAALKDSRIPIARWDEDKEIIVCSSSKNEARQLDLRSLPVPLSASVVRHSENDVTSKWVLFDSDDYEEAMAEGEITMVVAKKQKHGKLKKVTDVRLLKMEAGGLVPSVKEINGILDAAATRLEEWNIVLQW